MPFFSIIIPTFNNFFYAERALHSCLSQTFEDYEVIITDHSSSTTIYNLYTSITDSRVTYYRVAASNSAIANWNHGITKANGNYLKLLHHDDFFNNTHALYVLYQMARFMDKKVIFNNYFNLSETNNTIQISHTSPKYLADLAANPLTLLFSNKLGSPSNLTWRRDVNVSFNEAYKWLVDVDVYIYLLLNNQFYYCYSPIITCTCDGEHQISRKYEHDYDYILIESVDLLSSHGFHSRAVILFYILRLLIIYGSRTNWSSRLKSKLSRILYPFPILPLQVFLYLLKILRMIVKSGIATCRFKTSLSTIRRLRP